MDKPGSFELSRSQLSSSRDFGMNPREMSRCGHAPTYEVRKEVKLFAVIRDAIFVADERWARMTEFMEGRPASGHRTQIDPVHTESIMRTTLPYEVENDPSLSFDGSPSVWVWTKSRIFKETYGSDPRGPEAARGSGCEGARTKMGGRNLNVSEGSETKKCHAGRFDDLKKSYRRHSAFDSLSLSFFKSNTRARKCLDSLTMSGHVDLMLGYSSAICNLVI
ncbi:hypothetical protein B0H34DRAFT_674362 [Crassisporium funariophilum]|nr:hypothetical protein B0H34DRAFT_674362 [Crassisporium funariophilum]